MNQGVISTDKAPLPGNYSQARYVYLEGITVVYTSGQTGNDPLTDKVVEGGIGPQTKQALKNIEAILGQVDGKLSDVVKVTVFMKDMASNKAEFEQAYRSCFKDPLPARSLVEVVEIPLVSEPTIVEIEAIAYV